MTIKFSTLAQKQAFGNVAWLMVGEKTSEKSIRSAVTKGFSICTFGKATATLHADIAHVIDIETIISHGTAIESRAKFVLMPEEPHVKGWATGRSLSDFSNDLPVLAKLRQEGRLVSYPLFSALGSPSGEPVFGDLDDEEVPLRLLVAAGVRRARHVGIQRLRPRSTGFEASHRALTGKTGGIPALRRVSGLSYGPYGLPIPARVFVGTDEAQMMGVRVLHYSIEKFSTMDVVVEALDPALVPVPKDPRNRSKTGFSFCRFNIPKLCGYKGRGIYVDADMQVFTDITDLWSMPLDDADLLYSLTHPTQGRTPQTSVMLLNCEKLRWDVNDIVGGLDSGRYSYKQLMSGLCIVPPDRHKPLLPYRWNSLERYDPGLTSLIHYTDMPTQPWISHDNSNGHIWYATCREALETGFISMSEVDKAIRSGHISPELPQWIGLGGGSSYRDMLPTWVPPFHRFTKMDRPIEGKVVLGADRRLRGWAWYPKSPAERLRLGIYSDDVKLFEFAATDYAEILARHGKGDGNYAFDFELPAELLRTNAHKLRICTADGVHEIAGSPVDLVR